MREETGDDGPPGEEVRQAEEEEGQLCSFTEGAGDSEAESEEVVYDMNYEFDEEFLERERAEHAERLHKAQSTLDMQTTAWDRVCSKVAESDEQAAGDGLGSPSGRSLSPVTLAAERPSVHGGRCIGDLHNNSISLGSVIGANEGRYERFHRRAKELHDQQHRKVAQMDTKVKQMDLKVESVLKERWEEIRKRVFLQQKRRGEQQKAIRELQMEKDRVWENYYMAKHAEVSSQSRGSSAGTKVSKGHSSSDSQLMRMSNQSTRSMESVPAGVASEAIYRDMVKSHSVYDKKMTELKQIVLENDRRTAQYWNKTVGPGYYNVDEKKKTSTRTRVCKVKNVLAANEGMQMLGSGWSSGSTVAEKKDDSLPDIGDSRGLSTSMSKGPWSNGWEEKRLRCQASLEEQSRQRDENWKRMENTINTVRSNYDRINTEIKNKALERSRQLSERQAESSRRRAAVAQMSDEGLNRRMQLGKERREEHERQRDEENRRRGEHKTQLIHDNLMQSRSLMEQSIQKTLNAMQEKDQQTKQHYNMYYENLSERLATSGGHAEKVEEKLAMKKSIDREYRNKTIAEIAAKDNRHTLAVTRMRTGAFERQRALRRSRTAPNVKKQSSFDSAQTDEGSPGASPAQSPRTPSKSRAAAGDVPAGSPAGGQPTITPLSSGLGSTIGALEHLGMAISPDSTQAEQLRVLMEAEAEYEKRASNEPQRCLKTGDATDDAEITFLNDLNDRATTWLQTMRADREL